MKYSHTEKLTLSIKAEKLYKICTPIVSIPVFQKKVKDELYQCCCGEIAGGYDNHNWEQAFFYYLITDKVAKLTDYGKTLFTWGESE